MIHPVVVLSFVRHPTSHDSSRSCVVFCVVVDVQVSINGKATDLSIFCMANLLASGQSYDSICSHEITLKEMGKILSHQNSTKPTRPE